MDDQEILFDILYNHLAKHIKDKKTLTASTKALMREVEGFIDDLAE